MAAKYRRKKKTIEKSTPNESSALADFQISDSYKSALMAYWNGNANKAIEILTARLEQDEVIAESVPFYRLWIEILADKNELAALRNLADHFSFRMETAESEDELMYDTALLGLIHYELDEIEAAGLMARVVRQHENNTYVAELSQLTKNRLNADKLSKHLFNLKNKVWDYCQLSTLAKTLFLDKDNFNFKWVVDRVQRLYPESPLGEVFAMQELVEKKDYNAAQAFARQLTKRFPENADYAFYHGYVSAQAGDLENAINELTRANQLFKEQDPDVLSWLGYCMSRKAVRDRSGVLKNEAERYLKNAVEVFQHMGLPATFPSQELAYLLKQFSQGPATTSHSKLWMVKVPASEFITYKTADLAQIETVTRSLPANAKAGDLCLIVGDDYVSQHHKDRNTTWRIGALYSVASAPYRHPYKGLVADLTLINRQDTISIPINVTKLIAQQNGDGSMANRESARGHGVYELDAPQQRMIAEILEDFSDEAARLSDSLNYFRQSV